MVPHRSLTNANRWLHSRRHPVPFPLTTFYSSLSQSILYWQKFLLIFATVMIPHRSPTNTSRREQSHPHPSATFPSNAFPSDSLLFQSFPKHLIWEKFLLICDHHGPTSEPNYWQKLLLILVTIKQCLFLWLPSIPSIASPNAPPRTDHQAMPFPHNCPTSEPNKHKSTRTSPTTDRICLGTSFDSSVLPPPQTHVLFNFSAVLIDFSMVLLNFARVLLDFTLMLPQCV